MGKLANRVAVITGGSTGIGLATAKLFVSEGAQVFISGRRQGELDRAKNEIGDKLVTIQGDVAKPEDLDKFYRKVKEHAGKIDVVFANAGVIERKLLADASLDHFDTTFNINVRGVFLTVQKALPLLSDGASIILNASVLNFRGLPEHSVYCATKAAVRSFARTWSLELKDRGIRVNVISPGATDTPIIDAQFESKEVAAKVRQEFANIITLGRLAKAEEMASGALFLASQDSSYMTGADLQIDGGWGQY